MSCEGDYEACASGVRDLRADFNLVVGRWRLTQAEIRAVLGLAKTATGMVEPGELGFEAIRRARLVVVVDRGLTALFGDPARISSWLRSPARPFEGRTPLEAMAELEVLVALSRVTGLDLTFDHPAGDGR